MAAAPDWRNSTEMLDGALEVGPEMQSGKWTRGESPVLSFRAVAIEVPELSAQTAPWLHCMGRAETSISRNCPNRFAET